MKIGIVADIQYANCEAQGNRFYRHSLAKLEACVSDLNQEQVDCAIQLGDLVDRNLIQNIDSVLIRFSALNAPVYHLTGNHDYDEGVENDTLYKKLGMPAEYYSATRLNWRFVLLNTNEVSSYAHVEGTWKEQELTSMLDHVQKNHKNNAQPWNGGVSSRQLEWLKIQLDEAQKAAEWVLVFSHHPLYPPMGLTALNDEQILDLLSGYSCVKGVISGHHHKGDYGVYKEIPCITFEGMVETENANAFGVIEFFDDELVLTGRGRGQSRCIPIR